MLPKWIAIAGVIFAGLGVVIGSFGAHALKGKLGVEALNQFEVGVRYQMYHALGLIALALLTIHFPENLLNYAAYTMIIGIIIFSGSLYTLSLSGVKWWGAITPIGGLLLILSWTLLAIGLWKR